MTAPPDDTTTDTSAIIAALRAERDAALAREAALAEVLEVINRSPDDPQPVFEAILEKARFLCGAEMGALQDWDGEYIRVLARYGYSEDVQAHLTPLRQRSRPGLGQQPVLLGARFAHVLDAIKVEIRADEDEGVRNFIERSGTRTWLAVPLRRTNSLVGFISVARSVVRAFTDTEIVMLEGLAAQAVIAMENARLITEQREALEQQTATAEVLQVINASPGNLAPVFDAMLEKALALCGSAFGTLDIFDGEMFHVVASRGLPTALANYFQKPITPAPGMTLHRVVLGEDIVHVADLMDDDAYRSRLPTRVALVDLGGARTQLIVSLRKDNRLIGVIMVYRREVRRYTDKQIALLTAFADQAVIAMENARLLGELRQRTGDLQESLEYQTATSDVLKVISRSTFDLQPVLTMVAETAVRLCFADQAVIFRREGELYALAANFGFPAEYEAYWTSLGAVAVDLDSPFVGFRCIREACPVHIHDVAAVPGYGSYGEAPIRLGRQRTSLGVPLLREGEVIGTIVLARQRVEPFTDRQIELVRTFADQAVIAIENTRLLTEQQEALERQTATAEVLQVINASPGNLTPVFDAVLEKAMRLCGAAFGSLYTYDGERFHSAAQRGVPPAYAAFRAENPPLMTPGGGPATLLETRRPLQVLDLRAHETNQPDWPAVQAMVELGGIRTILTVPLLKDEAFLGYISIFRQEVRAFADKQIALLENFAAQAVIAMENARLITEQREALEQQTATAEVLQVINASPGNLAPVFDAILQKAHDLCGAAIGALVLYDGEYFRGVATHGFPEEHAELVRQPHAASAFFPFFAALVRGERLVHIHDLRAAESRRQDALSRSHLETARTRTALLVPLRKDDRLLGFISAYRLEVRPFLEKEIALLGNFAAQAVIAMENARLLDELRARTDELAQRQAELRVTFENMGDGVAMFDETQHLIAWNRKFQDILDVPDDIIARRQTFSEYVGYLSERGEYGADADVEEQVHRLLETTNQMRIIERVRPNGQVIEVRSNPVAGGGFVLIYADITERKRSEAEIRAARDAAEKASRTIEAAYRELKTAQANLIQAEKMASLGQLTAGIAHEIKNPLNFVNNFSALSTELIDELREVLAPEPLGETARTEVDDLTALLKGNLEKVVQHGQRADGIVRGMLDHSRGTSGERRMVDLNALIDEALNLAYHGARAQDQSFNITLERDFGEGIAPIEVNPQDIMRVFLNIFSNGFYAVTGRAREGGDAAFAPTLKVTTIDAGEAVAIRVRDNGTGIPADIRDKLFQPFFTTKPTGEGTGLGLSITYDIITQQHGGSITVDSKVGEYSEFVIRLPRKP